MHTYQSIAYIESCYKDKFGTPRQPGLVHEALAKIKLHPSVQPELSLQGVQDFSHLWLIWSFHKNSNQRFHAKVHPPRLNGGSIGLFATRSPHRPNPIGLSVVKLVEYIAPDILIVGGVDLIDGTPILDIKPYVPEVDCIVNSKSGWLPEVAPALDIKISWSKQAEIKLPMWSQVDSGLELVGLVENTIRQDPRPLVYKELDPKSQDLKRNHHAIRLGSADVHFCYSSDSTRVEIVDIILNGGQK